MTLTKNELNLMDLLWSTANPLSRGEILESADADKKWKDTSIHIILNSLLKKGAIREAGFTKCGKTVGRTYAPAMSCEEYYVQYLATTEVKPDPVALIRAYAAECELDDETKAEMRAALA